MSWREERLRRERARELEQRLRELDRIDEECGLGAWLVEEPPAKRSFGQRFLVFIVVSAVGWWGVSTLGFDDELGAVVAAVAGDRRSDVVSEAPDVPADVAAVQPQPPEARTPKANSSVQPRSEPAAQDDARSGTDVARSGDPGGDEQEPPEPRMNPNAPPVVEGGGSFVRATQSGTSEPVTWDPCKPIEVVVNPEGAPNNYESLIRGALSSASAPSGFNLEYLGEVHHATSDELPEPGEPVLVSWATASTVPALAGDVAGVAGTQWVHNGAGRARYLSGAVVLDRETYSDPTLDPNVGQAVLEHELAHVLGLDHVDDPRELMFPTTTSRVESGAGDLEGLARLGNVPCG